MSNGRGLRPPERPSSRLLRDELGVAIHRPDSADEFLSDENIYVLESWHTPLDGTASIARTRLPPGQATKRHALDGIDERYIVVAGRGRVRVGGIEPTEVGPGDIVYIPAGQSQEICSTGDSDLVVYCVCTPPFDADSYRELPAHGD